MMAGIAQLLVRTETTAKLIYFLPRLLASQFCAPSADVPPPPRENSQHLQAEQLAQTASIHSIHFDNGR